MKPIISGVSHIAIAVPNLDEAINKFEKAFNIQVKSIRSVLSHKVRVAFFDLTNTSIELLEAIDDSSPIAKFITKNPKGGIHHISFSSSDIKLAAKHLEKNGIEILPRRNKSSKDVYQDIGANNKPVLFLSPSSLFKTLFEIEQE